MSTDLRTQFLNYMTLQRFAYHTKRTAAEFGVEIVICEMSMDLMGIHREEIIDFPNITIAGAAKFLQEAGSSKVTLFI